MKLFNTEALFSFFLFAFLAASLAINISNLYDQSIRLDESQSIWFSTKPLFNVLQIAAEDVHMPLYYVLLHIWLQIFGVNIPVARTLSLIFFMATLPVLFLLAKESANYKTAVLSIVFFALSPFVVWYSSETRMYTLFIFITILSSLYFLRFIKTMGKGSRIPLFLTTLVGMYTHYFYWFVIASQSLYVFYIYIVDVVKRRNIGRTFQESIKASLDLVLNYLLQLTAAIFFVMPWLFFFLSQGAGSNMQPQIAQPTSYTIFETFVNFLFGFQSPSVLSFFISLWPLFTILIFLLFTAHKKMELGNTSYFVFLTTIPIALAVLISFIKPVYLPRYFIFITPALFYLIAKGVVNLTGRTYSVSVVIIVLMMFGFMTFQNVSANTPAKENYVYAAEYLEEKAEPQDIIVITPPFTIYPLEYYYRGFARLTTIPEWDRYSIGPIPEFTISDLSKKLEDFQITYKEMYVVFSYDQGYERDIREYLDNNYHLVEEKDFSYDLKIRVYRLRYD